MGTKLRLIGSLGKAVLAGCLRMKRVEKDITQEMLALQCNIDRSYMGRIERGEVNLTVEKLYMIAKVLEVDVKQLLP